MCIFFIQPVGETWTEKCNVVFETYDIYRTIIVSDNIDTLSHILESELHSIYILVGDDYCREFDQFIASFKRVLLMTYDQYIQSYDSILYTLMDQHNLLILEGLEPDQNRYIIDSIQCAEGTGFISKERMYYIWENTAFNNLNFRFGNRP